MTRSLATSLIAAAFVACGSESPEQQLAEANELLKEVRAEVTAREERVEDQRKVVLRAEQELARARTQLQAAEADLAEARGRIMARATDVALFRAVQTALLENERLGDFAIRVEVSGAKEVTLHGEVDEQAQAKAAVDTARAMPGVGNVVSEIQVRNHSGD